MDLEQLVSRVTLDVVLPSASAPEQLRETVFYDENLSFSAVLSIPSPPDASPPAEVLQLLTHAHLSYDIAYISPLSHAPPPSIRLGAPPKQRAQGLAIVPPATPNPMPASQEHDRRYVRTEGTHLLSGAFTSGEFSLEYDGEKGCWKATYGLRATLSYIPTPYTSPLLSITAHLTVRPTPRPLSALPDALRALLSADPAEPETPATAEAAPFGRFFSGLEEVNLLGGLSASTADDLDAGVLALPTTRLGASARANEFALRPLRKDEDKEEAEQLLRAKPTVKKSFRRTVNIANAVRVRMRTVFVPHSLLPLAGSKEASGNDDVSDGASERAIVLCVEVEHAPEAGAAGSDFELLDVRVEVASAASLPGAPSGGEARAELIGSTPFPIRLGDGAQHNLLYAVSLLNLPAGSLDVLSGDADVPPHKVGIYVSGRPVSISSDDDDGAEVHPTAEFTSRWNTTLAISSSSASAHNSLPPAQRQTQREALPEPPSPFPAPRTATSATFASAGQITAKAPTLLSAVASRRQSAPTPSNTSTLGLPQPHQPRPAPHRASTGPGLPTLNERPSTDGYFPSAPTSPSRSGAVTPLGDKRAYTPTPPSVAVAAYARTPLTASFPSFAHAQSQAGLGLGMGTLRTTFGPPPPTPLSAAHGMIPPPAPIFPDGDDQFISTEFGLSSPPPGVGFANMPTTPAYPAYGASTPGLASGGVTPVGGARIGPSVDVVRGGTPGGAAVNLGGKEEVPEQRAVVVSVAVVVEDEDEGYASASSSLKEGEVEKKQKRLYPHQRFTLDVLVANRSDTVRRLEVSVPPRPRRREVQGKDVEQPGIVPLDNRVRVGPLRPGAVQSTTLSFRALKPGMHNLDALILADVETGAVVVCRKVCTVYVWERPPGAAGGDGDEEEEETMGDDQADEALQDVAL
ncbi:unnamed protein product [Peniophora sp. CBMAI 1063]|nr:unnamed protein product [Peniophora sp. CBMAI 1063]